MIKIGKIWIDKVNDKSRCNCKIEINSEKKIIWFEVDNKYEKYLCTERSDAYVIGLLSYAMRNKLDIECETPITERLLYQINEILIPSLVKHSKSLNTIRIEAPVADEIAEGNAVGTGLSCGVDSFWSISMHENSKYKDMNITHLCINNVGAFNECYAEYGEDKVKEERYRIAEEVAEQLGMELIKTDSNFGEIEQDHLLTSTYSCCFAIYMLQKLWKTYYLASNGIDYAEFSLKDNDIRPSEQSELLVLQGLSISNLNIYCDGGGKNRFEKTQDISDYKLARKYLHVCINKPYNCGVCSKCKRTLLSLDALNKLDEFKESFNIKYYKENKKMYYNWLYMMHFKHDRMNEPVFQILKKRKEFKKLTRYSKIISKIKSTMSDNTREKIKKILNYK